MFTRYCRHECRDAVALWRVFLPDIFFAFDIDQKSYAFHAAARENHAQQTARSSVRGYARRKTALKICAVRARRSSSQRRRRRSMKTDMRKVCGSEPRRASPKIATRTVR